MIVGATTKPEPAAKDKDAQSRGEQKESSSDPRGSPQSSSDSAPSSSSSANVCSISVNSYKFVYLDHLPYTLVAQGTAEESDSFLSAYLHDVRDVITSYLGAGTGVVAADDVQAIRGVTDLIHHLLQKYSTDLAYLCSGTRWVYLDDEVREQVDRLLANLEESSANTSASGHLMGGQAQQQQQQQAQQGQPEIMGTMLVLGGSILHSRLANNSSRMVRARSFAAHRMRDLECAVFDQF
jgi:hypothetical protein